MLLLCHFKGGKYKIICQNFLQNKLVLQVKTTAEFAKVYELTLKFTYFSKAFYPFY